MKKIFTTFELREIGGRLFSAWEQDKGNLKLSGKNTYNLLQLKKRLEEELTLIEETVTSIALKHQGTPTEEGNLLIPEECREEANKDFKDFSEKEIEISYDSIKVREEDFVPIGIFEALLSFIEYNEQ